MVDLSVEFAGVTFRNPIIAASATPTKDSKAMKKAIDAGFGGVVAKSLCGNSAAVGRLSLIHISEPTRPRLISVRRTSHAHSWLT